MKQSARDNIIYLAVGLSIAALLAGDAFYSLSHDLKIWMPSRFALRLVATTILLVYFVIKQTHQTHQIRVALQKKVGLLNWEQRRSTSRDMRAGKAEEKKSALQRSPQVRKWCSIQVAPAFCGGYFRVADNTRTGCFWDRKSV